MSLEGRIDIDLHRRNGRVEAVVIRSSRPQLAQKLLAGRTPDEVPQLIGRVFSLCGKAQAHAARLACTTAQGRPCDVHNQAVRIELGLEHAWRLLLNWPQQAGLQRDQTSLLTLRKTPPEQFAERLEELLSERLLGLPAATWLQFDLAGFDAWSASGATPLAQLFARLGDGPDLGQSQLPWLPPVQDWSQTDINELAEATLADPAFCAQPTWHGQPAETGAVVRQCQTRLLSQWLAQRGRGSGARLLARLLELAQLPVQLRSDQPALARAWKLDKNRAAAGVETSRGLLLHVVRLVDGQIADYRILAPTEWNFHPQGPLSAALLDLPADAHLPERARHTALALDPCVDYGLEIIDD